MINEKPPQNDPKPEVPMPPENDSVPKEFPEVDPQQPNEFPLEAPTNPDTERKQEIIT
jgi:hypothetical protein